YWVPYLDSFVNYQAEGAKGDHLEQWRLAANGSYLRVFSSQWYPGSFVANGVNGLFINVTSHLLWTGIDYQGGIQSFAYNWSSNGTLGSEAYFYQSASNTSKYPNPRIAPQISSDEHRYTIVASGPAFQTAWWPYGGNESFVVDPTPDHLAFYSSNVSVGHLLNSTYYPTQSYANSYALDGQYFDTSRLISYYSYDCFATFVPHVTTCPIAGTTPGTVPGTIYYVWRTGLNASPNPVANGQAQAAPPTDPTVQTTRGIDWINVSWNDSQSPLINFTVYWGPSAFSLPNSASLGPQNRSFNITGLSPGATYSIRVVALNLHSVDNGTLVNTTLFPDANTPADVRVAGVNATDLTLRWTNPPSGVLNDTVYVGRSCGVWIQQDSVGVVSSYRIRSLVPQTHYCMQVASWNRSGEGPLSANVSATTAGVPKAPASLQATPVGSASISLAWVNPPGLLVNITLLFGLSCGHWTNRLSLGVVSQRIVTGLLPDTTYCFAVLAWNQSGPGTLSLPVLGTPLASVPDPATQLGISDVTNSTAELSWVLPVGLRDTNLLNVSIYQGDRCGNWSAQTGLGTVTDNFQAANLRSLTAYSWSVALWNSAGESVLSTCANTTTLPPLVVPPPTPAFSYLTLTDIAATSVTVSWTYHGGLGASATSNVEYFIVLVGTSCASPEQSNLATKSPATVNGLIPSTNYCFAVSAIYPSYPPVTSGSLSASTPGLTGTTTPPIHSTPPHGTFPTVAIEIAVVSVAIGALALGSVLALRQRRPPGP
ncbi:MAG: fibronectin type III domain-containing protein, partial [Thermoplasmata archaeon]|nr:fibronectin type III domain-containing protein [Thermoplasmata archaeon]